jgi:uncharacterized membrane protein YeaQ/YmgE (transglycosylase-associated protein family)
VSLVFLVIIGAAAGFIATRILGMETSIVTTISIGILGALLGGLVLRFLLVLTGMAAGLVGATLGALLLIGLWHWISRR